MAEFSKTKIDLGKRTPALVKVRPDFAKFWPSLADGGKRRAGIGPSLADAAIDESGLNLAGRQIVAADTVCVRTATAPVKASVERFVCFDCPAHGGSLCRSQICWDSENA